MNSWDETKEEVSAVVKEHDLTYTIVLEGSEVAEKYGVFWYPTVLWLDAKGVVTDVELGYHGPEDLEKRTMQLLEVGKSP